MIFNVDQTILGMAAESKDLAEKMKVTFGSKFEKLNADIFAEFKSAVLNINNMVDLILR